ncbi:hypothetical protein ACN08Y_02505 [Rothia sp. P5764]|uniref:hypothetical protein n=1 Tax=Rothia sp. P5764 TaxID=3402654 RepID=UPI003AC39DC5
MTATNPVWAEETGLHAPGAEKKRRARSARIQGSWAVFHMLRNQKTMATLLPLLLPIGIAALIMLLVGINSLLTGMSFGAHGGFINANSLHTTIVPVVLGVSSLLGFYSHAQLVLNMGRTRWSYLGGFTLLSLFRASLATLIYALTSVIELVTHGYGRGWQVFNPELDPWPFAFWQSYSTPGRFYALGSYLATWLAVLIAVQVAGIAVAALYLRWGKVTGSVALILTVIGALAISRNLFGGHLWDMGISTLWEQFESNYSSFNGWEVAEASGGFLDEHTNIVNVPELASIIGHYGLLLGAAAVSYLVATMTWARTSLR